MDLPKIVAKNPTPADLEEGKRYAWCSCGMSENGIFCNGSHRGSDFSPRVFEAEDTKTAYMCLCKQTKNPNGFCDGSHKAL